MTRSYSVAHAGCPAATVTGLFSVSAARGQRDSCAGDGTKRTVDDVDLVGLAEEELFLRRRKGMSASCSGGSCEWTAATTSSLPPPLHAPSPSAHSLVPKRAQYPSMPPETNGPPLEPDRVLQKGEQTTNLLSADSTVADNLDRVVGWGGVDQGAEGERDCRERRGVPGSACCGHLRGPTVGGERDASGWGCCSGGWALGVVG